MKRKLFFSLSFLISLAAFSQEYHPLLENPSWIVIRYYSGQAAASQNRIIEQPVDAQIGDVNYKRFIDPYFQTGNIEDGYVYLREDVLQKKVYRLNNGLEKLIYDFSLQNGDTFLQDGHTYNASVNDTLIGGVTRKKRALQLNNTTSVDFRQTWIEGIGSDVHPLEPYYNVQVNLTFYHKRFNHTKCAFQNGQHIYGLDNCTDLLETKQDIFAETANIYPNPVRSEMNIRYDKGFQSLNVKIFNAVGQLVHQADGQKGPLITLFLNELPKGFYTVQLIEEGKWLETKKVIID